MRIITWLCYCGNKEVEEVDDGSDTITRQTRRVELSCCPTGNYCKSPFWDKSIDEEFARKVAEGQKFGQAMQGVKPLRKGKGK